MLGLTHDFNVWWPGFGAVCARARACVCPCVSVCVCMYVYVRTHGGVLVFLLDQ
jgi:hypothetical protein